MGNTCWLLGFLKLPRHDWSIKGGTVSKMVCRRPGETMTRHSLTTPEFSFSHLWFTTTNHDFSLFYLTSCLKQKSFIITRTANAPDFQILKTKGLKEQ